MEDQIPGLNTIQSKGRGAPEKEPGVKPAGEGARVSTVTTVEGLLLPVALAGGATASGIESAAFRTAIGVLTGFKVSKDAGTAANPAGAALFLLPQPFGMLPERFFMQKPRVPGTRVHVDLFFTAEQQLERMGDRRREEARIAQRAELARLLPDLTEEELLTLATRRDLQRRFVQFVPGAEIDALIQRERNERTREQAGAASDAEKRFGEVVIFDIGPPLNVSGIDLEDKHPLILDALRVLASLQEFMRGNPPDP